MSRKTVMVAPVNCNALLGELMVGLPFAVLLNIVLDFALGCAFLSCHHGCICYFWIPNIQHKFSHAAGRDYKNKETSLIGLERIAKSVFDFVECLRLRFCGKPMLIRVKQWNSYSEPKCQIRMRSIRLGPGVEPYKHRFPVVGALAKRPTPLHRKAPK